MAKVNNERPKMGDLIKKLPDIVTPVQEVRPIESKKAGEEQVRINGFWVPSSLARSIKLHSANTDMTQREILIEALEIYLSKYVIK